MEAEEFESKLIEFNKEKRHCTVITIFVNHNTDIEITQDAKMTGVFLSNI